MIQNVWLVFFSMRGQNKVKIATRHLSNAQEHTEHLDKCFDAIFTYLCHTHRKNYQFNVNVRKK
jgi:hypothetical protein